MDYLPHIDRYTQGMDYRKCGNSGIKLPLISLGFWHNFGGVDSYENGLNIVKYAFDHGITHFDLANNYGPPFGSAEENFGKMMKDHFRAYRDEMIITTKAGHHMWNGPYGDGGSRKNLMASIDHSLKRMNLEYVDIFYSHRYDAETPLDETLQALVDIVKRGKALYVGLSKYPIDKLLYAFEFLKNAGTPCLVYQDRYNLIDRHIENYQLKAAAANGTGVVAFSPLAQGMLTDKYLHGIPEGSRAARPEGYLKSEMITSEIIDKVRCFRKIAQQREQSISQMALSWLIAQPEVTSVIIGARTIEQLQENLRSISNYHFDTQELANIEQIIRE